MADRSDLIRLLTAHRTDDPQERDYRLRMLDLAAAALDPFDRHHYEPGHFTASGFVLHPDVTRVLLVHHAKLDLWLQPGGHVDPEDETLLGAAMREIREETGIAATPITSSLVDIDIHVFPGTGSQARHQHFDLRFAFVAAQPEIGDSEEILDARWVAMEELADLGVDRSVTRPVSKLLAGGDSLGA